MKKETKMDVMFASMGPQLYRCGNEHSFCVCTAFRLASMGPQLYRCGNSQLCIIDMNVKLAASMGPQLYRCGNFLGSILPQRSCPCFNGAATLSLRKSSDDSRKNYPTNQLQWGRNFIVAEIPFTLLNLPLGKSMLQWGRNFIVAEMAITWRE